jgi:hypothetical protein
VALRTVGGAVLALPNLPTYSVTTNTTITLSSGDAAYTLTPVGAPAQMGIIYCHPLGGTGNEITSDLVCQQLARWGFPVIGALDGGMSSWGNDASRTCMDAKLAYLAASQGADASHVALYSISMGGATALSWAQAHLGIINFYACLAGVASVQTFHDQQSALSINAAYGGLAGWNAAAATHDPLQIAQANHLTGLRGKMWIGSTDTVIDAPTSPAALQTAVPGLDILTYTYGAGGHFDIVYIDPVSVATAIARSYAPTAALFAPLA